jgi:hypothetical protein
MDLLFQLPLIQTKDVDSHLMGGTYQRYEVCGLWQEDHLKINDGKVKENRQLVPLA